MGLDFNHSDAHWSYSGFNDFRRHLAKDIGIDLDKMIGFNGDRSWSGIKDPLCLLLNHSDCDGHLTPNQCKKIAPRLREVISKWEDSIMSNEGYDKKNALLLAKGMEWCGKNNVPLEFC